MGKWLQYDTDIWGYDNTKMPYLSVADEIEYKNLPQDVRDLVERRFDFYYYTHAKAYEQGYEDGRYEAKQELDKRINETI